MFVSQQIVPRWKEWLPLATNQLRLRNLIQILAFSIKRSGDGGDSSKGLKTSNGQKMKSDESMYYYTLHSTTMSAPFYTSEKVSSDSPKWKEIEVGSFTGNVSNSADAFVIRLWSTKTKASGEEAIDEVVAVWGVYLNGLTYLGKKLGKDIPLKPNSIVFVMPGGYFTDVNCLESKAKVRCTSVAVNQSDVQLSYTVNTLTRLHTIQQVIKKELAEVDILKQKISMGDFFRSGPRGRTVLRRLLSKNKPQFSHQDYIRVKENIEVAKFRVHVLTEEKSLLKVKLNELKTRIDKLSDENHMMESKIMENYRLLMRKVQVQRETKRDYISKRESQLHSKAKLNFRAKQLISELDLIYPIVETSPGKFTIGGVHLPNSEDFAGHDDIQLSVALGFVTHVIQMISVILQVPLRYPVIHFGSRSRIIDHISDNIPESEREFPLFLRGKEKIHFHYAVYLLNKNIAQLRCLCGLPTLDLRNTLSNLSSLVKMKSESATLERSNRSISSSTVDVCSLCLSASSPAGSVLSLSNKKDGRSQRVSESCADDATNSLSPRHSTPVMGHRISKSVGSAKDLMIGGFPANNLKEKYSTGGSGGTVKNLLSYSLDKGLNKFENVESGKDAEPLNRHDSREVNECNKSWDKSVAVEYSRKDSPVQGVEKESGKVQIEITGYDSVPPQFADKVDEELYDVEVAVEGLLANEMSYDESNIHIKTTLANEELKCDSSILRSGEIKKCTDHSNDDSDESCLIGTDNLLENVTSRTEALANQATSFNRFRTRFNSTVENSS